MCGERDHGSLDSGWLEGGVALLNNKKSLSIPSHRGVVGR